MVSATQIHYGIGRKTILHGVDAHFAPGKISMILGPNGSGKSTLLKILSGDITQFDGQVLINGQPLRNQSTAALAQYRAVMSQEPHLQFPLSVEEVIMMGRYPFFQSTPHHKDQQVCEDVISLLQLESFRHRNYLTLSGGEKQRVQYARVLAQIWEPPASGYRYLFLDEPLNSLDIRYQLEFMQAAHSLLNEQTVIIAILHDLNLALRFGDHFLCLKEGRVSASGDLSSITPELLQELFDVPVKMIHTADHAIPQVMIG